MRALLSLASLTLLAACASISEEACRAGDWRGIGQQDGARGRGLDYVQNHAEACGKIGIAPDIALWTEGRDQGLPLYCTPRNAFETGKRGHRLNAVCQSFDTATLDRANAQGQRYHEVGQDIAAVQREINERDYRITQLLAGEVTPEVKGEIRALRREINRGYRALNRLQDEQRLYAYF